MISAAPVEPVTAPADHGAELKRGALTNTVALLASNFRGVFTFLVARLLGPAILGAFLVAWNTVELLSKFSLFGIENTLIAFIARAEAAGDHARSHGFFRLAVFLALAQSSLVACVAFFAIRIFGERLGFEHQLIAPLSVMIFSLPGIALYAANTAVSRGMKVMRHDIFSRGLTESSVTSVAFLIALSLGARIFGPAYAAVAGTSASGIVAFFLARSLFRRVPLPQQFNYRAEAKHLLGYAANISIYEVLNAFIVRLDVIMLAGFVGRAPGVTLPAVGIYGAVVEVAAGLRKVNQAFNPIFAPVVAGLTIGGKQDRAAAEFGRVAQWMLWVLIPLFAVMIFAGGTILSIYGAAFREGWPWLVIVAIACGTNAFVGLAETVIMVQKPRLNVWNSAITCVLAVIANFFLIQTFGVMGAAFGILLPYVLLGILRRRALRKVFKWRNPWAGISPPFLGALIALPLAIILRLTIHGIVGEIASAAAFLATYFVAWRYYRARAMAAADG
ncbi:MAG TPA: oligosaccharide flippase family protein [Chthoniobacterales bacterium]|jgi:O-antigen/teichoic acid export membrane protein